MRSKPHNPNTRKVAIALLILAVAWLIVGTLFLLKMKDTIINKTYSGSSQNAQVEQNQDADAGDDAEEPEDEDFDDGDDADDSDDDVYDDDTDGNDGSGDSGITIENEDDEEDFDDDDDADDDVNADDDDDDDDADDDDDVKTFTVDAWDGFAAVRTGRGTGYQQVGRLNNGAKVKVTDLENGWYKIASGKWKGYYLHKSSLK